MNTMALNLELKKLADVLKANGVRKVRVEFNGGGDSGSFEAPTIEPEEAGAIEVDWEYEDKRFSPESGDWGAVVVKDTMCLLDVVTLVAERQVEEKGVDWYNNDGGFGYFDLDLESGVYFLEINQYFLESECAAFVSLSLDELEDEAHA